MALKSHEVAVVSTHAEDHVALSEKLFTYKTHIRHSRARH